MNTYTKDPDALLDYTVDWSDWLEDDETITTSEFIVPNTFTITTESSNSTSGTAWISGGTSGYHQVTHRITTTDGRSDDRSFWIYIKER